MVSAAACMIRTQRATVMMVLVTIDVRAHGAMLTDLVAILHRVQACFFRIQSEATLMQRVGIFGLVSRGTSHLGLVERQNSKRWFYHYSWGGGRAHTRPQRVALKGPSKLEAGQ